MSDYKYSIEAKNVNKTFLNILNTFVIKPAGFFYKVIYFIFAKSYLTMFKWESFKASLWFIFIFIDNI